MPGSEYLSEFSHYFFKAYETGIYNKLELYCYLSSNLPPREEPESLVVANVMFDFSGNNYPPYMSERD